MMASALASQSQSATTLSHPPLFHSVWSEKSRRAERRRRAYEEHKEVRRIHQEEKEEAPTGWTAVAPSDRVVDLIAVKECNEEGCPV